MNGGVVTWSAGTLEAALTGHGRVYGGGGPAAEVNHTGRGRWGRGSLLLALVVLCGVGGGDAVLRQKLLQVHVFQLKGVSIVGQGLVPQGRAQKSRLWGVGSTDIFFQLLLLLFPKTFKSHTLLIPHITCTHIYTHVCALVRSILPFTHPGLQECNTLTAQT